MAKRRATSTPAIAALEQAGVAHVVHAYAHDPGNLVGYGLEAADALGVPAGRVFKTLVAQVDDTMALAVVPVEHTLDLKALARVVGGKRAALADPVDAERATGYVRGGISPLGGRKRLDAVVDESALAQPTVFVSAGRRGLDVELAPADIVSLLDAVVAAIARQR